MDSKGEAEEKFSNHPCHRLSVPAAKRFWCRHCFEMFDDPISRWRHSKTCKNTGLSNLTRRKEQEATALEAYRESTCQKKGEDSKHVILPNLNPRSTNKSYIGPKENNVVDLSCFICQKQFSTMEEMKEHVRVPCNKVIPVSDDVFPFPTRSSTMTRASSSTTEVIYHGATSGQSTSGTVYEIEDDATPTTKRTPSPLDPSNLSSETMAAVEALNMMARSDKVNLTQFLNHLSEGGFVIEQAAGTSTGNDSQDREIVFTVQGDVGESGELLQHGGDITVEVAEDLIRMAQRVRVEAVERVVEEQVQEEVIQEDLEHQTEVQYIQDQAQLVQEQPQYVEDQTQYLDQPQYVDDQPQFVQEQTQLVQVEPVDQQNEYIEAEPQLVQEQPQYDSEESESVQSSTYTIMNVETGKEYTGQIVTEGHLSTISVESLSDNAQVLVVPVDQNVVPKQDPENLLSIPDGKRKLEEISIVEGQVEVKVENGSQVKKFCTDVVIEQNVPETNIKEEAFEAKKKLQFFNEGLIVQEKCNKNSKPIEKTSEIKSKEPSDSLENLPDLPQEEPCNSSAQTPDTCKEKLFLDEVDGLFKPMTEEMIKLEEMVKLEEKLVDMSTLMFVESTSQDEKLTVIKKKSHIKQPPPSPKKLRSSSRTLVLTPKKKKLIEEKEKKSKKNVKVKVPNTKHHVNDVTGNMPEPSIKKEPEELPVKKNPGKPPIKKPHELKTIEKRTGQSEIKKNQGQMSIKKQPGETQVKKEPGKPPTKKQSEVEQNTTKHVKKLNKVKPAKPEVEQNVTKPVEKLNKVKPAKPEVEQNVTKPVEKLNKVKPAKPEVEQNVTKPVEKLNKVKPAKQLKCRACEKVFSSLKLLQKHKTVPCVVKITRNLCQKILRPKRALPKPPEKKVVKKKVVKHDKDSKKPKLLPVGFRIQAQWIPCKRERKPSKGRGRPRKHSVHYERKKHIILPNRTLEVSSLSDKEQFFFELGLVCSEYVLKQFRRPLPLPQPFTESVTSISMSEDCQTVHSTSRLGSVDHEVQEVKATTPVPVCVYSAAAACTTLSVNVDFDMSEKSGDDISPPLLEKIEPTHLNEFESAQPPDISEEELEPPLLEPVSQEMCEGTSGEEIDLDSAESPVNSSRHFLDSFSSDDVSKQSNIASNTNSKEKLDVSLPEKVEGSTVKADNVVKAASPRRINVMEQLKSTLKTVCSPQKSSCSSVVKIPDITSDIASQANRNLFETLQTMCTRSTETHCTLTYSSSPKLSVLCNSVQTSHERQSSIKTCSQRKSLSAESSPKKSPNILLRRSVSESSSKERTDGILDIVAKSMGITVSEMDTLSSTNQDEHQKNKDLPVTCSPGRATSSRSASDDQRYRSKNSFSPKSKNNLFENCEALLSSSSKSEVDNSECLSELEKNHLELKKLPQKKTKTPDTIQPQVSLTSSETGQILVSPLKQEKNPVKNASVDHRGVKRKLCDASTQCEHVASTSPVKAMLGQLEHRLKLLKSALRSQGTLKTEAETSYGVKLKEKKDILPELVSVLLKHRSGEMNKTRESLKSGSADDKDKNLPDVVRCVTENKNNLDHTSISTIDKTLNQLKFEKAMHTSIDASVKEMSTEDSSDCLFVSEQNDSSSEDLADSKVTVQYINQLEPGMSSGVTYLLIQQDGMEDYLTSISTDLELGSGETIHAVTVEEEEVLTEPVPSKLYTNESVSRTTDHEVLVNSSGF